MKEMKFVKMHGTGNDFILFVVPEKKQAFFTSAVIRKLCVRHQGIGADGLILVLPARPVRSPDRQTGRPADQQTDFRMRIFNADGNEAEMCGNGIRCLGKLVYEKSLTRKKQLLIETLSGQIPIKLFTKNNKVEKITVNIPAQPQIVSLSPLVFRHILGRKKYVIVGVLLGNPHCVIFIPTNVRDFPVEKYGPLIERHRLFPRRTNVEFVHIQNKTKIKMRVWERGVGETLACGTGACAAVVAGVAINRLKPSLGIKVGLPGGDLMVSWNNPLSPPLLRGIKRVVLTGPAETVFEGIIYAKSRKFVATKAQRHQEE